MITAWTRHLSNDEDKEQFIKGVQGSKWLLSHLDTIFVQMEKDLNRAEVNPKTYDLPNWAYRQAHNNGYRQCLELIRKLINLDHKE